MRNINPDGPFLTRRKSKTVDVPQRHRTSSAGYKNGFIYVPRDYYSCSSRRFRHIVRIAHATRRTRRTVATAVPFPADSPIEASEHAAIVSGSRDAGRDEPIKRPRRIRHARQTCDQDGGRDDGPGISRPGRRRQPDRSERARGDRPHGRGDRRASAPRGGACIPRTTTDLSSRDAAHTQHEQRGVNERIHIRTSAIFIRLRWVESSRWPLFSPGVLESVSRS